MFERAPESPLAVGEIVAAAMAVVRGNLAQVLRLMMIPTIILMTGSICLQLGMGVDAQNFTPVMHSGAHGPATEVARLGSDAAAGAKSMSLADLGRAILLVIVGALITGVGSVLLLVRQLALVRVVTGFSPNLEAALVATKTRTGSLVGILTLFFAITVVLTTVFVVVSILWIGVSVAMMRASAALVPLGVIGLVVAAVAFVGFFLVVWMELMVALCVLSCEETNVIDAVVRSIKLIFSSRGVLRGLLFAGLVLSVVYAVNLPLSLPIVGLTLFDMFKQGLGEPTFSAHYRAPMWILIASQIWESSIQLFVRPATICAFGLFYLDLRVRAEGVDISRRLERLKNPSASAG